VSNDRELVPPLTASLRDDLERLTSTGTGKQRDHSLPAGWAPSVSYAPGGRAEVTAIGAGVPAEQDWNADVRALGVTVPEGFTCRLVEVKHNPAAWVRHGQGDDATVEPVTLRRYVVEPARNGSAGDCVTELLAAIGKRRPKPRPRTSSDVAAFVYPVADWQLGKTAYGQGTAETVQRVYDSLERGLDTLKTWRRRGIGDIVLAGLGDMCEGVVSQKGAVALASDLTMTEQARAYRRLLLEHVQAFAPLTDRLLVPVAPGNHDQPHRLMGSTPRGDDSWAIEGAVAVADALALAGGYDHVEIVVPAVDELTVTVETAGTVLGCAHGHQMRAHKAHAWLAEQAHARTRIGAADILLTGHFHTFESAFDGGRYWFQIPTQDPGSPWYDARHGGGALGGGVAMTVLDGKPLDLAWI
jgi:hypothetical protein